MFQMRKPADSPATRILTDLRNGLLGLHKTLLDSERAVYERDVQKIETPGQLLTLVLNDPWFQYLRELSRFVVQIDEKIDDAEQPATDVDAQGYLKRVRALLQPAEHGQGFERRYFEALQRDPNVVLAHAPTTRLIAGLRAA